MNLYNDGLGQIDITNVNFFYICGCLRVTFCLIFSSSIIAALINHDCKIDFSSVKS